MATYTRTPPDEYKGTYVRCSVCNAYNKLGRSPVGGRYYPPSSVSTTDTVTGKSFYTDNAASQGCWFCGSPAWNSGGKAGDLKVRHS